MTKVELIEMNAKLVKEVSELKANDSGYKFEMPEMPEITAQDVTVAGVGMAVGAGIYWAVEQFL